MIKEAYCSFEVSKLLKEKGFPQLLGDDGCVNRIPYYCSNGNLWTGDIGLLRQRYFHEASAPTHQMALEWLREEKNLIITIDYDRYPISDENKTIIGYGYSIQTKGNPEGYYSMCVPVCNDYEEAVEAALKYALKYCLTKLI